MVASSISASGAYAQAAADSSAITQAALDYIEGWYEGNAERMEWALHPEQAKRIVQTNPRNGRSTLEQQSLINNTKNGGGQETPVDQRRKDVRILDIFGNAASVRVDASTWVE